MCEKKKREIGLYDYTILLFLRLLSPELFLQAVIDDDDSAKVSLGMEGETHFL